MGAEYTLQAEGTQSGHKECTQWAKCLHSEQQAYTVGRVHAQQAEGIHSGAKCIYCRQRVYTVDIRVYIVGKVSTQCTDCQSPYTASTVYTLEAEGIHSVYIVGRVHTL